MKTLRKTAITIAMAAIACAVFTACGTGNDDGAVQPKEVVATKAVVTTAAEQTEAKTTTTTTEATTSEPEVKKTTTEAITTSEPETTTTEATEPEVTTTEVTTPAKDELLSVEECIKWLVSERVGEEVEISNIDCDEISGRMSVTFNNGMVADTKNVAFHYAAGDKTSLENYNIGSGIKSDYFITYYG